MLISLKLKIYAVSVAGFSELRLQDEYDALTSFAFNVFQLLVSLN